MINKKAGVKIKLLTDKGDPYYNKYILQNKRRHLFHIVDESPWPIAMGWAVFMTFVGFVMYIHMNEKAGVLFFLGLIFVIYTLINWWRDVIREATFLGHHTKIVKMMMQAGMKLFLLTEVMFFVGFFWPFIYSIYSSSNFCKYMKKNCVRRWEIF